MSPLAMLVSLSIQTALVVAAACAVAALARLRSPHALLMHYRLAFVVSLGMPLLTLLWRPDPMAGAMTPITVIVEASQAVSAQTSPTIVSWAWRLLAAVTLLRLLWFGRSCWQLRRLRLAGRLLAPKPAVIAEAERLVGVEATWIGTDAVRGPATYGWRRPIVLIPEAALTDSDTSRLMFTHELIHIKRRDWLTVMIEQAVAAILWFHPSIWLLLERLHLYREQVVDRETVALTGDARAYALALVDGASLPGSVEPRVAPAWLSARHLRARIAAVTEGVNMSRLRVRATLVVMAGLVLASGLVSGRAFAVSATAQADDRIYESGEKVTLPKAVTTVRPGYTQAAMDKKIQGSMVMSVIVLRDGTVGDVTVTKSLDQTYGLDDKGVEAMRQWRFEPGMVDGKPVNVRVSVEMTFTLK